MKHSLRRIVLFPLFLVVGLLAGCATMKPAVVVNPNFDGTYRLIYSGSSTAIYYRFLSDGSLYASRTDAPQDDVLSAMRDGGDQEFSVNVGTWRVTDSALVISVTEKNTSYNTRFDIRDGGVITLSGMKRKFDFLGDNAADDGRDISNR